METSSAVNTIRPDVGRHIRCHDAAAATADVARRWAVEEIPADIPDFDERRDGMLARGWEPYGADLRGTHMRRRNVDGPRAIVLDRNLIDKRAARDLFEGWRVITARSAIGPLVDVPNMLFTRIALLWRPTSDHDRRWVEESLKPRLHSGARLEWII